MYAVTSRLLLSRTLQIFRSAEFGFFGVMVRTTVQTPRFCGAPLSFNRLCFRVLYANCRSGAFERFSAGFRPLRTSWLIVGKPCLLRDELERRPCAGLRSKSISLYRCFIKVTSFDRCVKHFAIGPNQD